MTILCIGIVTVNKLSLGCLLSSVVNCDVTVSVNNYESGLVLDYFVNELK